MIKSCGSKTFRAAVLTPQLSERYVEKRTHKPPGGVIRFYAWNPTDEKQTSAEERDEKYKHGVDHE